jgi:hypothetical protein
LCKCPRLDHRISPQIARPLQIGLDNAGPWRKPGWPTAQLIQGQRPVSLGWPMGSCTGCQSLTLCFVGKFGSKLEDLCRNASDFHRLQICFAIPEDSLGDALT